MCMCLAGKGERAGKIMIWNSCAKVLPGVESNTGVS